MDVTVDLNADLGEGFGRWSLTDDTGLLDVVTSANVACGFHAGDPSTMRRVCELAAERDVAIGAQVSYRDLFGFGRREMVVPAPELADEVTYQIGALDAFARAAGSRVSYVKPHGALHNRTVWDEEQAAAVVAGVRGTGIDLPVLALAGSRLLAAAEAAGLDAWSEAFPDRGYDAAGRLVPRSSPAALVEDHAEVARRAVSIAVTGTVVAVDGSQVAVHALSLCVHGDSPGAVEAARSVRGALEAAGVAVRRLD
ncbi:MAG TPA: 5-oxoprolinase subunit PxpA [Dermatophilaceae bacterium]|nr:5-oxoprolinase subunit PxpA [Dermatophilaceae bacterium]